MLLPPLFEEADTSSLLLPPMPAMVAQIASGAPSCGEGMALVVGTHHEVAQRVCTDHRKTGCWSFFPGLVAWEGLETSVSVCMDEYEWPNKKGAIPEVMMTYVEAQASCKKLGKRMCTEFEWELACEGASTSPFPYGWSQEKSACINDKPYRPIDEKKITSNDPDVRRRETDRLFQAEPSGSRERCKSAAGIFDLVGNVEEWVTTSRVEWPHASSLKGGYWSKPWSGCRGTNESHAPNFRFYQIGFRCCADPTVAAP